MVEVSALFLFLFILRVTLKICKIDLSPHYLRRLDSRVVRTSDFESVGHGSIPGGCVSNFFSFVFFLR